MEIFSNLSSSSLHPSCVCVYLHQQSYYSRVLSSGKRKYFFLFAALPPISFFPFLWSSLIPYSQYPNCHVWMSYEKCERYVISCTLYYIKVFFPWILKTQRFFMQQKYHIIETTSYGSWNIVCFGINFSAATK